MSATGDLFPETLGLTLEEGKQLLANVQTHFVEQQIMTFIEQYQACPQCGQPYTCKDHKTITMRTIFGKFELSSPRFYTCNCQSQPKRGLSPLAHHLPDRTTPELKCLHTKWAALMSYGLTADLLAEVLPIQSDTRTLRRHIHQVADKIEQELGKEQPSFIEGNFLIWDQLPEPNPLLTVGIDGGYVHAREGTNRKAGWFEVIVGKSIPEEGDAKRFAFVHKYDDTPRRRLYETLKAQGFQMRQSITFLSDGGDTVRNLQHLISPQADHILDWFHVTMRFTVLKQMAKRFVTLSPLENILSDLDSVKWLLWHGNVFKASQRLRWLEMDCECVDRNELTDRERFDKLYKTLYELMAYVESNKPFIPNYGERYRHGECISTAFAESAVNEVISRRMVKKQQMRWTQQGAHLLLQVRTKVLNEDLRNTFCRWYPNLDTDDVVARCA